nr:putative ribonuclease h protein [Quercus suber]
MRWRIGDGESINVYDDNWLPGKGSAKVLSPQSGALEGARVAALINSDTRTWDQNVLQQHFLSFEACRIRAIPLCWTDQEDSLIWPACKDGNYSAKMGYQLLCESEISGVASSSDSSEQSLFWKRIWKLHIPNKIKMFLWRVCSNALPTMANLKKRKILEDANCKACHVAEENTLHAIWDCEKLHHIWFPCFSWVRTEVPQFQDVQELIYLVGQRRDSLELFVVVAWFIWSHRNKLRLNEKGLATDRILQAAKTYLLEF